ncbi:MOSC domain-containing protein [Methylobacterium sp. 17Sr1-1]|uniref:MOSC domain-containing protein n=1 Tax=Methylobacterium sp. 17Sr1-1 TaxID=2202826 RepID=UPI000D6EFC82|nr:MOSC domain-containing protein [Methylobacterium sp. 17Sr1-1]AWN51060.1 MOSC domain-containing protein [Methylobacterium sp. 17Sr1-1]
MITRIQPVVLAGPVAPLGPDGPPSGIAKRPVPGPWKITTTGIVGDAQGDLRYHGGPEKALHHYPQDHYPTWAGEIGDHPLLSAPGAFGENLATSGWTEHDVCVGDIVRFGPVLLQVSQGRQPCFKLDRRFGHPGMARAVQATGRTGWYWRVLEEGSVEPGEALVLHERLQPDWPLSRLVHLFYRDTRNRGDLEAVARLPELAESWRALARRRLESGSVEDWSRRLTGVGKSDA